MNEFKRILVVSRSTRHCQKAVHYGISLARQYNAKLFVIHVVHDPFNLEGWNLAVPSLEEEYERMLKTDRENIDNIIKAEQARGMDITVVIKEGEPVQEILDMVKREEIDLLILLAHEEGRIEHFLFGRTNETLFRKLPCSMIFVKKEPEPVE